MSSTLLNSSGDRDRLIPVSPPATLASSASSRLQGGGGGGGGASSSARDRQSYKLVSLSPSDEDSDLEALVGGGGGGGGNGVGGAAGGVSAASAAGAVPDLNLGVPDHQHRQRRKIRLKRKQRDRLSAGSPLGSESGGGGGGGGLDLDWDLCCCCSGPSPSPHHHPHQQHSSPLRSVASFCSGLITLVVILLLTYFTVQNHARISAAELEIENVVEERDDLKTKFQDLRSQMQEVLSNQTKLRRNISTYHSSLSSLSSQFTSLNSSLSEVLASLRSAPELKNLPSQVDEVKTLVAQFGSQLKDFETRLDKVEEFEKGLAAETEQSGGASSRSAPPSLADIANGTRLLRRDVDSLDSRVTNVGAEIAEQLHKGETRAAKSWEMIASLQSNYQNLSEKLSQVEGRCEKAEAALEEKRIGKAPTDTPAEKNGQKDEDEDEEEGADGQSEQ